jgi:chromosomal replication initiator protein
MSQSFPFDLFLKNNSSQKQPEIVKANLEDIYSKDSTASEDFSDSEKEGLADGILNVLMKRIPEQKFQTYFADSFAVREIQPHQIIFTTATQYLLELIEKNYTQVLKAAVRDVLGRELDIKVELLEKIEHSYKKALAKPKSANEAKFTLDLNYTEKEQESKAESLYVNHINPQITEMMIDPNKTFDTYVTGPSNNMAFSTALAVGQNPGKKGSYPSLYIHSGSGLGKTHLLHAVANEVNSRYPELVICLISSQDFIREMINSIQNNNMETFTKKYSEKVDVLMIDDVHEIKNKERTQDEFFNIFNALHKKGKQLIFTSDMHPSKIEGIHDRIKTRLGWGLVVDIQKPDLETRIAILKRKASELDLFLADDILNLIATSIRSSIRELEGALIKLHAYSQISEVDFDIETVRENLQLTAPEDTRVLTVEAIAKATSQYYKIPLADLKSKSRIKEVAKARHIAMYLCRKCLNLTFDEIGKYFGGRDHSSVVHAEKTVIQRLQKDISLSRDINYIENNL